MPCSAVVSRRSTRNTTTPWPISRKLRSRLSTHLPSDMRKRKPSRQEAWLNMRWTKSQFRLISSKNIPRFMARMNPKIFQPFKPQMSATTASTNLSRWSSTSRKRPRATSLSTRTYRRTFATRLSSPSHPHPRMISRQPVDSRKPHLTRTIVQTSSPSSLCRKSSSHFCS